MALNFLQTPISTQGPFNVKTTNKRKMESARPGDVGALGSVEIQKFIAAGPKVAYHTVRAEKDKGHYKFSKSGLVCSEI